MARRRYNRTGTLAATEASDVAAAPPVGPGAIAPGAAPADATGPGAGPPPGAAPASQVAGPPGVALGMPRAGLAPPGAPAVPTVPISGSASPPRARVKFPPNPNVGDTFKHLVWDGEKWTNRAGGDGRSADAAEQANQLPKTRPEGIGRRCWRAVCEIYALTRKGGQWIDVSSLLDTVREGTGDKSLSLRTLKTALSYLRKGGFIDR